MTSQELALQILPLEKRLKAFALKLTGDQVEAADLYQEMTYRAIRSSGHYRTDRNLSGWLMTIMRNIFINGYRKKRIRQNYQDWSTNGYLINNNAKEASNEGVAKVDYEELINLVNKLEKHLKIPFLMYYKGFKYEEIAEDLKTPLGTIKSRIHSARKVLRAKVAQLYA